MTFVFLFACCLSILVLTMDGRLLYGTPMIIGLGWISQALGAPKHCHSKREGRRAQRVVHEAAPVYLYSVSLPVSLALTTIDHDGRELTADRPE
jgi:hypothetical protein